MGNLQVKNVPEGLQRKIRAAARRRRRTVRDLVLDAMQREIARDEFRARLAKREPVELRKAAAQLLGEVRPEREKRW